MPAFGRCRGRCQWILLRLITTPPAGRPRAYGLLTLPPPYTACPVVAAAVTVPLTPVATLGLIGYANALHPLLLDTVPALPSFGYALPANITVL